MHRDCNIGVVIGNSNSPHAMNIMNGIDQAVKELDVNLVYFMNVSSPYTAQLYPSEEYGGWDDQKSAIYDYAGFGKMDVLIMTYGMMSIFRKGEIGKRYLERFHSSKCVLINEETDQSDWTSIITDNYYGTYELTEHLVKEHGYRKFAFLGGPLGNTDARQRKQAFCDVMKKYDIEINESNIETGDFSECVQKQVNALLDRVEGLEAIVCANDVMALTAYQECEKRGLNVGRDIAITGYDDWERVRHLNVPMTTVYQDSEKLGYLAVYSALELFRGQSAKRHVIPARLKIRASCGCSKSHKPAKYKDTNVKLIEEEQKNTVYRQKTWIVPIVSRNMLIEQKNREKFLKSAMRPLWFFGVKRSFLYLYNEPVEYDKEKGWEFPDKIYLAAHQDGEEVEIFKEDQYSVRLEVCRFAGEEIQAEKNHPSVFCILAGDTQYGVLSVDITPEEVDMIYLISIQMANALMIYHTEKKRAAEQHERELLLQELRSKNEILNFISERDELTQIQNRRGFMEKAMQLNRQNTDKKAVIIFADMDGLKKINDIYGHAAGDIAICACADILKDIAEADGIAGRLGGDEFAIMFIGDEAAAKEKVKDLHERIRMYNESKNNSFNISMSIGVQVITCREALSIISVLEKADKIMYEEKKSKGRER